MSYTPPLGSAADFTWLGAAAYTPPPGGAAVLDFSAGLAVDGRAAAPSPLGAPAVLAAGVRQAWAAAPSPLGAPQGRAWVLFGRAAVAGPLGAPAVLGTHGFLSSAWVAAASPLGAGAVLGRPVALAAAAGPSPLGAAGVWGLVPVAGWGAAASPLGAVAVLARQPALATAAAPAVLGACRVLALHDFTVALGTAVSRYVMDVVTPTGALRVPISSWQATLQTGASCYVQCVVPACAPWVGSIGEATEFVIYRRAVLGDAAIEYEMARAPLQWTLDRGPTNYTATLSGYAAAFAVDEAPAPATDRTLAGVRSTSRTAGRVRARCAMDWLLRPGQRAVLDGQPFVVSFINYYVPSGGDAYMDVGS